MPSRDSSTHSNYALLDGTVIRIDRVHHQKPCYCMKTRHHGITLQGLTDPYGDLAWISDGLPGSVYDLTAARTHGILDACRDAGLLLLADRGYIGVGDGVLLPYRFWKKELGPACKAANNAHAAVRCRVERGFATLKAWRVLTRVRASPERVTHYARAILILRTTHPIMRMEKAHLQTLQLPDRQVSVWWVRGAYRVGTSRPRLPPRHVQPQGGMVSDSFVHLHVHTEYSMLDGAAKLKDMFAECERLGMPAAGDHRPRQHVRRLRLLPAGHCRRDQADRRHRGVPRARVPASTRSVCAGASPARSATTSSGSGAYTHQTIWARNDEACTT